MAPRARARCVGHQVGIFRGLLAGIDSLGRGRWRPCPVNPRFNVAFEAGYLVAGQSPAAGRSLAVWLYTIIVLVDRMLSLATASVSNHHFASGRSLSSRTEFMLTPSIAS